MKERSSRQLKQLLPAFLNRVGRLYKDRPDMIVAAWPHVIGKNLAPMTKAISFSEGVLIVKVNNSTLYSLLSQTEKPRLIQNLRDKFPTVAIHTIRFQLG